MATSPRLPGIHRTPEQIILIDVDGDGCADMVRVSSSGIELHMNRGGRGFAPPVRYPVIPQPIPGTVRAVDMNGTGLFGLIYATRRGAGTAYAYFSFAQAQRPYLLEGVDNGMGLSSTINYTPMTQMALNDRTEGRLWSTTMPFPLWVVSATEETDSVRGRTSRVEYRYHDGHFDTLFRRFQGFSEVEKLEKGFDPPRPLMIWALIVWRKL